MGPVWRGLLCGWMAMSVAATQADETGDSAASLQEVLDRAAERFERQDYKSARLAYEQATRLDPGSIIAWRGLGWTLWQLGDRIRAFEVWNDIAKIRPHEAEIILALAQAHEYLDNWHEAVDHYSRFLEQRPYERPALMGRARIYQRLGQLDSSERDLRTLLTHHPADFDAKFMLAQICQATDRPAEAETLIDELVGRAPEPRHLRQMADVMLELNRSEEAIRYYRQNLQANPGNRGSILGLARAHAQLHQYAAALSALESYLASDPDDAKIREELARFAGYAGDYAIAEKHLRVLVREHPDEIKWRISLAQILQRSGQIEEPVAIAREAVTQEPDNINALRILLDNATFHDNRVEAIHWMERLVAVDDSDVRLLNQLGELHVALGNEHARNDRPAAADEAYAKSVAIFRRARKLDPLNADALLGMATSLRLGGHYTEAIKMAEEALERHPSVARARSELYLSWLALGDLDRAEELLRSTLDIYRGNMRFSQELARVRFRKGEREAAIDDVQRLLDEPIRPSVPVLLYHGISDAAARDAMPLQNFRDQMLALKREGYSAITIHQLLDFYENGATLPPKPVLITFDDARADSFRYADPVLREVDFKATMFVPVAEVGQHGPYNAVWETLRELYESGRWDMQCHSNRGHSPVALDGGATASANFLTNRMWLEDAGRMETREEFIARLDDDYRTCGEELKRRLPGLELVGYAFPFGEAGQKTFSNEADALAINKTLATRYYKIGFIQDPAAQVTRITEAAVLPRFEVPSTFSGHELLEQLRSTDAYTSTQLLLADLYSWDGRYAEADAIFEQVALSDNVSVADLLARRGRVQLWRGDLAGARSLLLAATAVAPEHRAAQQNLAQIDRRTLPSASAEGTFYSDNRERSSFSVGPSGTVFLSDRVLLTASYRNKRFTDDAFTAAEPPPREDLDGETLQPDQEPPATAGLETAGHELTGELTYRWDWKTQLAVSAGVARFDERSATQAFSEPDPFPIASARLNFALGRAADVSLGATRTYVHAAGTVLDELGATGGEARLQLQPLSDTKLDVRYVYWRYDDSNARNTVVASAMQQVLNRPEIEVGYRFTFDHTRESDPLFYTPDRYVGHDAVIKLSFKPSGYLSFGAEAAFGSGEERGTGEKTQASVLGNVRLRLGDGFNVYLSGGSSEAADFRSSQLTAGLSVTF